VGVRIVATFNKSIKERLLHCLAAMLDIEVESALGQRVFNVRHDLLLNACLIVAYVLAHQLPELLGAL